MIFIYLFIICIINVNVNSYVVNNNNNGLSEGSNVVNEDNVNNAFDGVYAECFIHLSYTCIQRKTLTYLNELNTLKEVSVFGDHLKFVKLNKTNINDDNEISKEINKSTSSHDLSLLIDKAVDNFFDRHALRVTALGKDIFVPRTVDEFVGRKRRKGGGGGGGGDHHEGHGDGGKKKIMMMVMMCMKMKLMMMIPAMMGMMGVMSFKGMMFSMMSFMIAKMMLLMKILEKKNGGGAGAGDGGGWAAGGGGGGGAWMPAGGQDYGGGAGGGGGGYDANGQWQSRSIPTKIVQEEFEGEISPIISYSPYTRHKQKPLATLKNISDEIIKINMADKVKSRRKRSILDVLQNAYIYWASKFLGYNTPRPNNVNQQKYKIVNGIKYVYYPMKFIPKKPKLILPEPVESVNDDTTPEIITAPDFNKGEIVEGGFESRMRRKKFSKMKQTIDEALDDSPWQ